MNTLKTPYFSDWPKIDSAIAKDPAMEAAIADIVAQMTLEEKIGQMVQPNLRGVTPQQAKEYKLGSILNGGGAWPNENKYSSAQEWADKADEFWLAIEEAFADRPFRIPFMWATDAVHGHNNVFGATVFPHNIGLGCARDPDLIEKIGEITAIEVAATGLDWTFAPTVATPRDLRWGRVYEGYSEDPEITYAYAGRMVKGLQGNATELKSDYKVLSNVKHWVGDGGTQFGVDRGINDYSEDLLRNIHAMGYFSGLEAGAQVVMSSFNTWNNETNYDHAPESGPEYNYKIHGSKYLLTDVLKQKMAFDGVVVTDWHGHSEVSKCSDNNATYAINAGNDVLMVPEQEHWIDLYHQTVSDVKNGTIALSRIDDAVTRILRIKMRAGLWDKSQPSERLLAGKQSLIGATEHREVAREAVRKSLVLLKNKHQLLPLKRDQKVLLTGSAADDLNKQSGGWNLTWQGDENQLSDFPGATTLRMALEAELNSDCVTFDPYLETDLSQQQVAIVAFGEDPYAEMMGDIKEWQSLEFATLKRKYRADCELVDKLHKAGVKVISVFYSGRPLYLNSEIAKSDAFVAAFLPGSEGLGMTDVLLKDEHGEVNYDFQGTLSFSWPNHRNSARVSKLASHIPNYQVSANEQDPQGEHKPLFSYGYGLNYSNNLQSTDLDNLSVDALASDEVSKQQSMHIYGVRSTIGDFQLMGSLQGEDNGFEISRNNPMQFNGFSTRPYNYMQQQDAMEVQFQGKTANVYVMATGGAKESLSQYIENGSLTFDIKIKNIPTEPVLVSVQCGDSDIDREVDISGQLKNIDSFVEISIPAKEIVLNDNREFDRLFNMSTGGNLEAVLANIRWRNN
ncbi:glycoside hydrolase family 3 N-terminal domain-containing protein [Vibrio breoganii]|uniref:glycoside hydrolase family 3 protein n=1 Tax=Vibrio breoganii TaxID=553239 RepID=UPI000C82ACA8|nr:glycoside hydrolase family 3 protein [Vibrio breoganii]PMG95141.1 1,4-beta-D-glucan glucohydrolase [Vibrio breoganii]PMP03720.1 1,4-beta-D-glucan glucohydrolase [Vibrio breoganii]